MTYGWRASLRLIFTLCVILTTFPLATSAQDGTPTPVDLEAPGTAPSQTAEATDVAETPMPTEEVQPTESTDVVDEPIPTATSTETPTETPAETAATESPAQTSNLQAVGESGIGIGISQCGNNGRIGEFEFVPIQLALADTSYGCVPLDPSTTAIVTLTPLDGGEPMTLSTADVGDNISFGPVPAGTYTVTITIGEHSATSANLELLPSTPTLMPVLYFVEEGAPQQPSADGSGRLEINHVFCTDPERAGDVGFFEIGMQARSAVTDCEFGAADSASFSIQNADDPAIVIGPLGIDGSGQVAFDDVPAGNWIVIQNTAIASSQAFAVSDQITTSISVITYVPAFVDLFVEKIYCQDDERAGTTEFTLDTPPVGVIPLAVSATCFAESPFLERPPLTITLDNLDTGESFRDTIDVGGTWFDEIPSGMYTVTESIDGQEPITSEPFELVETGKRVRIINYEPEEERPAPDFEGAGNLNGLLLFCSAPDRDGDVDFIIESEARFATAAVATCDVGSFISGQLMLYPVDRDTGVVDVDAGETLHTGPFGDFSAYEILSGYYALGYQSPATGDLTVSEPFAIYGGGWASIEVNVFSAPVATGDIEIYKDFCVDPERAGEVGFQINEPPEEPGFPELLATASTECRYSNDSDGAFDFALTNVDTGRTWIQTLVGSDFITFTGIPTGTYTLTESRDGSEATSSPFAYEAGFGYYSIYVRNFIAEMDWQPDPGNNELASVSVYGYICVDLSRDGGAEYFHYGPVGQQGPEGEPGQPTAMLAATTSTAECREATGADGLSFTAIPADPEADPIPFTTDGTGYYFPATESLPSGDYVITETVTGVSTGTLRLSGIHNIDFLKYEPLPTGTVTVDVASADPAIANALPADATWSVSQDGTELFGDTFAAEHLQLPASIAVTNPVIYGTYEVTVNAGPTFEPYTQSFTVDEAVEVFEIVLQPVSPEPTAPVETNDVVVTVTTIDGGDIPTGTEICLTGSAYADCWALDAVAGSMIAAAAPSGTTVAFSDVPLGTYELTIPANDPYLAYAETIRVPEENPYQVLVVLLLQDVMPSPTATPGTVTPTATAIPGTATATATQAAVTGLPSTGNGAGDESSRVSTALLIGGSALAFSLALGLAWHQRRTPDTSV